MRATASTDTTHPQDERAGGDIWIEIEKGTALLEIGVEVARLIMEGRRTETLYWKGFQ